ncbi:hypothetical protein D3C78_1044670 [compost metagenome]
MQRVIPWVDERADTDGFAVHQRITDLTYFIHHAGQFNVLLKAGNRPIHLNATTPLHRHTQFGGDNTGHFLGTNLQLRDQGLDVTCTYARRRARPVGKCPARCRYGTVDVLFVTQWHATGDRLAGRVDHLGHALPGRHLPGAIDKQP